MSVMPDPGRKAQQLKRGLRPEFLRTLLGADYEAARVDVGVSNADSLPDRPVYAWIADDMQGALDDHVLPAVPEKFAATYRGSRRRV